MFKRLFWLSMGASLGFGTSWWVTKTVKRKVEQYAPARLTAGVANSAQAVTDGVRAALADGREAMRHREVELRAEFDARYLPREPNPERLPAALPVEPPAGQR